MQMCREEKVVYCEVWKPCEEWANNILFKIISHHILKQGSIIYFLSAWKIFFLKSQRRDSKAKQPTSQLLEAIESSQIWILLFNILQPMRGNLTLLNYGSPSHCINIHENGYSDGFLIHMTKFSTFPVLLLFFF